MAMISLEDHARKRAALAESLRASSQTGSLALDKPTSNLFRQRVQEPRQKLDVRDFNHVIRVDEQARTALVEGMTTYEELVRETLPFGLMPCVVPQLKSITIGGALAGIGIESSSFKYGFVHETVLAMDILLPDGRVVSATKENEHRDLFFGFANSYGTLGYALTVTLALIPVKKFVRLRHERYSDPETYFQALGRICRDGQVAFVDGTMFSGRELYITTGEWVDQAEWVSDYTYQHIYYRSIQQKTVDYLTAHDYLWRWDTDWFWCSKHFFVQHPLVRWLWGRKRLCSTVYWQVRNRFNRSPVAQRIAGALTGRQELVIQDVEIPLEQAPTFAAFFNREIGITPVWICPVAAYDPTASYPLYPMTPGMLYVNFGFWDAVKTDHEEGYFNKKVEATVRALHGKKSLYSDAYYSRDDFWQLYNEPAYRALKVRYDPAAKLKDLYEKCVLRK
ncbi:MAG: FAD-binding oxidoreductase [Nitrospira sp.]|jgi:FAD/FMN-containing dehydrogenase|nr:FAD-binding oxidoreductase [Nitrospira sp.]